MKKFYAVLLALVCTLSMSAAIQSKLGIYMYSDVEDAIHENLEEAVLIGVGTESTWATPSLHSFAGVGINTHNYGVYAVYGGNNYSEVYASESSMKNIPLVVVTSREAAANQKYSFYFDWDNDSENTGTITITDLRPKAPLTAPHTITITKGGEYAFELGAEDAFVAGSNCVIADRFVINYEAAKLDGLFGWGNYIDLIPQGNGTCKATVNFAHEGYYNFKVVEGANWYGNDTKIKRDYLSEANVVNNENITLWVDAKGDYTFTWNYASNTITLEYPALPTVLVEGAASFWGTNVTLTPAADGLSASGTHTFDAAGYYTFKVKIGADDYRSNGETFNRTYTEANWINTDHASGWNMTVNVDAPGTYTFTWTFVENKIEVGFPAISANSVTTNGYGFCSFASSQDVEFEDGIQAYVADYDGSSSVLDLNAIGKIVPAGTGVILYSTSTNTVFNYTTGVDATGVTVGTNNFVGVTTAADPAGIRAAGKEIYCLNGNALKQYVGTDDIPAGKAYLPVSVGGGSNNAPKHITMRFNNTTAVDNLDVEAGNVEKFIENGQIYIRRGNEVFNMQGQIVK